LKQSHRRVGGRRRCAALLRADPLGGRADVEVPVLMPTARLWKQLGAPHQLTYLAPTRDSVLGDWSLKSVEVPQGRFLVGVNERTLMAIVFAERPLSSLVSTFSACVGAQLEAFGVPPERIAAEVSVLRSATFGKNRTRTLLGILNEVAFQFEVAAENSKIASPAELLEIQAELNGIPHRASSPACNFACDAVVGLLGTHTFH
jgi:hypothetical protein